MIAKFVFVVAFLATVATCRGATSYYNPAILSDTRSVNSEAGVYHFDYHTQDGISHSSQSNDRKQVTGAVAYTDPTGLKVEINYAAGPLRSRPIPAAVDPTDDGSYDPRKYQTASRTTTVQRQQPSTSNSNTAGFDDDGYYYPGDSYYPEDTASEEAYYYPDDSYYYPEDSQQYYRT